MANTIIMAIEVMEDKEIMFPARKNKPMIAENLINIFNEAGIFLVFIVIFLLRFILSILDKMEIYI